jgi:hypothetical protein
LALQQGIEMVRVFLQHVIEQRLRFVHPALVDPAGRQCGRHIGIVGLLTEEPFQVRHRFRLSRALDQGLGQAKANVRSLWLHFQQALVVEDRLFAMIELNGHPAAPVKGAYGIGDEFEPQIEAEKRLQIAHLAKIDAGQGFENGRRFGVLLPRHREQPGRQLVHLSLLTAEQQPFQLHPLAHPFELPRAEEILLGLGKTAP